MESVTVYANQRSELIFEYIKIEDFTAKFQKFYNEGKVDKVYYNYNGFLVARLVSGRVYNIILKDKHNEKGNNG